MQMNSDIPRAARKIIHVDMDAFYASVEQRDFPELRGKPVAVGGSSARGVVAAASYEARAYGVHSAMPSVTAARRCPGLVFVRARFDVYKEVSRQIRAIFRRYTSILEPLSLDEAYLDVTHPLIGPPSATLIARAIRAAIREETGLTASAGVSFNKFLAKAGSAHRKPDGLTIITPEKAMAFVAALPVEKFFGVGPVTAARMHDLGWRTGAHLQEISEDDLVARFGKAGRYYFRMARCLDDRPVRPSRTRKSLGAERTFDHDLDDVEAMRDRLADIAGTVAERASNAGIVGHTVTLKIKYHDFEQTTRQTTTDGCVREPGEILEMADLLLRHGPEPPAKPVRLLGITLSNLRQIGEGPVPEQLTMSFRPPGPGSEPDGDVPGSDG